MNTKIYELTKLFLKNTLDFKVFFVLTLILPLIFLVWNNYSLLFKVVSDDFFYQLLFSYLGFIFIMQVMSGFAVSLLSYRENGFLKMFKYVTGSKSVILIANFIAQSITIFFTLLIFTLVACMLFLKFSLLIQTVLVVVLAFLVCIIPIAMLFLWIPALNIRLATISPITSLMAIALSFLASISIADNNIAEFFFLLNPVMLFTETLNGISHFLFEGMLDPYQGISIMVIMFTYVMIGLFFSKKVSVVSSLTRF